MGSGPHYYSSARTSLKSEKKVRCSEMDDTALFATWADLKAEGNNRVVRASTFGDGVGGISRETSKTPMDHHNSWELEDMDDDNAGKHTPRKSVGIGYGSEASTNRRSVAGMGHTKSLKSALARGL